MNIVIEGPDATGKSTLAQYIKAQTGFPVIESEGPPRRKGDIAERIERRLAMDNTIFVRHPVISHPIYDEARAQSGHASGETVSPLHKRQFYASHSILIYCRPLTDDPPHMLKTHDTPEHVALLNEYRPIIAHLYRLWAMRHARIIYEIGDDPQRVVNYISSFDPVRDVEDFHIKNVIDYVGKPRAFDFELLQFRLKFMREETREYETHMDEALDELDKLTRSPAFQVGELVFDDANFVHHLAQALDSLVDLVYVAIGTAHLHGFDFRRAWQRVHAANMLKVRAEGNARSLEERVKLKMIKPPGWEPPRHEDLVENHAHKE